MNRPASAALVCVALASLAACQSSTAPAPSSSPTTSASASPSAAADLTRPKAARKAVDALVKAAGGLPVIKVDITRSTATLSALKDGKVVAWAWKGGAVAPAESDIQYIQQATFDPSRYDIDDLGSIFAAAGRISGSTSNQELQIIEYDQGRVLMTVTTRPESMPVFFRADGTAINQLAFPSTAAFTEAIKDTATPGKRALAMGWDAQGGFWTDTASSTDGVIQRVTRQAKVPSWSAERKGTSSGPAFPASAVDPAVLSHLVRTLPTTTGQQGASVSFQIQRIDQMALPVITFTVGAQKVVTTLGGADITNVVGG